MALEGNLRWLEVEVHVLFGDIRDGECQVDKVASGIGFRASLSPQNFKKSVYTSLTAMRLYAFRSQA